MNNRQDLIDTYRRYEREVEQAEANARRLRNRMMRIAIQLAGTENLYTWDTTHARRIPVQFATEQGRSLLTN
jgi:hypothetical protein